MTTTWMAGMPMSTAIITRHPPFTGTFHHLITLTGAEGAAMIDASVWTHIAGEECEGTTLKSREKN